MLADVAALVGTADVVLGSADLQVFSPWSACHIMGAGRHTVSACSYRCSTMVRGAPWAVGHWSWEHGGHQGGFPPDPKMAGYPTISENGFAPKTPVFRENCRKPVFAKKTGFSWKIPM